MKSDYTLGSLFTGIGGLDLGVEMVFGPANRLWVSDIVERDKKGHVIGNAPAVIEKRFPGVPNLGDVTKIDWDSVPRVDVLTGGSPCFVAGTPVLTHDGLRPIEDVQVGDLVWTHAARWQRVTHTMRRTSATVEFRSGFYCTPEHRLWLRTPQQRWNNTIHRYRRHLDTPKWVEAKDAHNRFAASPVSVTHEGVSKPDTLTWWQIGRFVADGYVNHQVNVYIGKGKESDADKFPGWTHHQQMTALCLTMPKSAAERDWLTEHFGKLAHGKTLPAFLLAETEENRRAFLDGYWSGDGWKPEGRKFTQSNSVSACLTTGIELLAKSLDYTCTVSQYQVAPTKVIEGRNVNQRPWWMVRATPDDGRFTETDADWHWFKLRRTPKTGEVTTVYDLTVERDHSFIAAGIVVHNCQDLSVGGRRAGMMPGTRSGLWMSMFEGVKRIRPHLVVWENVRGSLSAPASSAADEENAHDYRPCVCSRADRRRGVHTHRSGAEALLQSARHGGDDGARTAAPTGYAVDVGRNPVPGQEADREVGRGVGVAHDGRSGCDLPACCQAVPATQDGAGGSGPGGVVDQAVTGATLGRAGDLDGGCETALLDPRGEDARTEHEVPGAEYCNVCGGCLNEAHSGMESAEGYLGDGSARPALRALGRVLGDLAGIGYDAGWCGVRASEVGAPHQRFRVFVLAWPKDDNWWLDRKMYRSQVPPRAVGVDRLLPTPTARDGKGRNQRNDDSCLWGAVEQHTRGSYFGPYQTAVDEWSRVFRPAPAPAEPSTKAGKYRLNAELPEWMMGFPRGWVTDVGLPRVQEFRALGGAVVPQQAALAITKIAYMA